MNKFLSLILALTFGFALVSCDNFSGSKSSKDGDSAVKTEQNGENNATDNESTSENGNTPQDVMSQFYDEIMLAVHTDNPDALDEVFGKYYDLVSAQDAKWRKEFFEATDNMLKTDEFKTFAKKHSDKLSQLKNLKKLVQLEESTSVEYIGSDNPNTVANQFYAEVKEMVYNDYVLGVESVYHKYYLYVSSQDKEWQKEFFEALNGIEVSEEFNNFGRRHGEELKYSEYINRFENLAQEIFD